ncbi:MAG: hypothetical protein ACLPWG_16530 [Steroidobacteraceae bacterium]
MSSDFSACHAGGRGFEPRLSRHHINGLVGLIRPVQPFRAAPFKPLAGFRSFAGARFPEARETAKRLVGGYDIELWSGERFVVRLDRDQD